MVGWTPPVVVPQEDEEVDLPPIKAIYFSQYVLQ